MAGRAWTHVEVATLVADYFDMLELELHGSPFSKVEHRRVLERQLDGRTHPSIEYKHRNVSAVLVEMGYPHLTGYMPAFNYQARLTEAVDHYLRTDSELRRRLDDVKNQGAGQ